MSEFAPNRIKTSPVGLWILIFAIAGLGIFTRTSASLIRGMVGSVSINPFVWLLGLLYSAISIILGIAGLARIPASSGKAKISGYAIAGLSLGAIWSIGLITGVIVPQFRGRIIYTKAQVAKAQITEFEWALQAYALDNGSLPTNEQGLEGLTSEKGKGPYLTRIIHEAFTAAADPGMSAALRSVGFLDVLSSTPAESSRRAPCIHARLSRLATNLHE